ncbi:MAG: helix-turn-helix domain-containing protein [Acidobacteria bacterium]|nr:helix-turn-helix domain-containing protein [Acidobacteriota bacterium]
MKIYVLALDGVFDTGLATVLDAFATANELAEMLKISSSYFDVSIIGVRETVATSQGFTVPIKRLDSIKPDWVVVPAIGFKMPNLLQAALARPDIQDAAIELKKWANSGVMIAAACIGTFILAESSLLDNQIATTTWWLSPLFRQRYPKVKLDESRMIIKSDQFVTAGAALSHIDLALWLIRQASPELASLTAKYLIVDNRPSQSVYVISDHLANSDPLVEKFERWARSQLAKGFSLDQAAQATLTSKRTLARRIKQVLGKSPLSYFQDLRVERAVHLLETSDSSIDEIATMVGYVDGVTLRTLLRRKLGRGVRDLRSS